MDAGDRAYGLADTDAYPADDNRAYGRGIDAYASSQAKADRQLRIRLGDDRLSPGLRSMSR